MSHLKCVVGFLRSCETDNIVCIRKKKPDWQRGKLNGVGGKCEYGNQKYTQWEEPIDAMKREWREEIGFDAPVEWKHFAMQRGTDYEVFYFKAEMLTFDDMPALPHVNDTGESVEQFSVECLINHWKHSTSPGLSWLLPLAFRSTQNLTVEAREAA